MRRAVCWILLWGPFSGTWAQQAGNWQVGAGWLHFAPRDSSQPLEFTAPVRSFVPGSGAKVGDADSLGLSATYFISSHWALEAAFGSPPKFDLSGTGTLAPVGSLGHARQWSPALLGKYYFKEGADRFRPFIGFGVTYVWYTAVSLDPGLQGALSTLIGRPPLATSTSAKIDSSFAPVFNGGLAYQFADHWGVALSLTYIPLKTKARLTTRSIGGFPVATSESALTLNPFVTSLFVTYRF